MNSVCRFIAIDSLTSLLFLKCFRFYFIRIASVLTNHFVFDVLAPFRLHLIQRLFSLYQMAKDADHCSLPQLDYRRIASMYGQGTSTFPPPSTIAHATQFPTPHYALLIPHPSS